LSPLAAKWIMENSRDARTRRQALDRIFAVQDDPAADDWAKAVASEGLRQIDPGEEDALPRLIGLIRGIKDQAAQWQRLSAAVAGLGRFGPAAREALPDLNRLIQAKNRRVRDAAREAIKAIDSASSTPSGNPQQSDSSQGSGDVTREMERLASPDPAEGVKGARTLRFMGPRAAPAIPDRIALLDENPDLRPVEQRYQFLSLNPAKPSPGSEALSLGGARRNSQARCHYRLRVCRL